MPTNPLDPMQNRDLSEAAIENFSSRVREVGDKIFLRPAHTIWSIDQLMTLPIKPRIVGFGLAPQKQEGMPCFADKDGNEWYVMRDGDGKLWRQGPF